MFKLNKSIGLWCFWNFNQWLIFFDFLTVQDDVDSISIFSFRDAKWKKKNVNTKTGRPAAEEIKRNACLTATSQRAGSGNVLLLATHTAGNLKSCYTHTHPFNGPLSRTTQVSRYQKGKTNVDFTEPRDSEWQWHQLGHMQVCTLLQTDNHASTSPLSFLQAGCPSCHPTNSVKALKAF